MKLKSLISLMMSPAALLLSASLAQAQVTTSGDVSPTTPPSTWTAGSTYLYVGETGNGSLTIPTGYSIGTLTNYLGYAAGATGTAFVSGGTWNTNGMVYVGEYGTGDIEITQGGVMNGYQGGYFTLGFEQGSSGTITVSGAGSKLLTTGANAGPVEVGDSGTGLLSITNGGTVINGKSDIGMNSGSSGTATVDGIGSSWGSAQLGVGENGQGTLNITNGSSVSVVQNTSVGAGGKINFGANGGTLTTGALLASGSQMSGTGTINTGGLVSDLNLVFNASQGASQSFTAGGITYNLNQSSSNSLGAGYLGSGSLSISGGVNIASSNGYLGYLAGSNGTATVQGAGSTWANSGGNLYVGNYGTGSLSITNGGSVTNSYTVSNTGNGYIGNYAGSTGSVTVSGAGSTLTNSSGDLYVGNNGAGSLSITNGGAVSDVNGWLGSGTGSSGVATVSGVGSKWTNTGAIEAGYYYGTGSLSITNGATVTSSAGNLGYESGTSGTVTVDGTGSAWTMAGALAVGHTGIGLNGQGTLNITNGSSVNVGTTTTVTNGAINFGANGGTLTTGTLYASPSQMSGTGTVNTAGIVSDVNLNFNASQPQSATQSVTANGITFNLTQSSSNVLGVGYAGSGTLGISGGATVSSSTGYLGYNAGSNGTATVSGAGSQWAMSSGFYDGYNGTGTLNILNGAAVNVTGNTTVGAGSTINFGANGGALTTGTLYASPSQMSGTGTINTAGLVSDLNLVFNASQGASQSFTAGGITYNLNQSSGQSLGAGYLGSGSLSISGGANIASSTGYLGYLAGSNGTAAVQGSGSKWTNTGSFYDGYSGTGNLNISGGGTVSNIAYGADGYLGYLAGSNGTATVQGTGSTWANNYLYVGYYGAGSLSITNGGTVTSLNSGYLGFNAKGSTGSLTVDGAGSSYTDGTTLWVGAVGTGLLSIANGGAVSNTTGYVGDIAGSNGAVTVQGTGSTWTNKNGLEVGVSGAGSLFITNGGVVNDLAGTIGNSAGSTGTVTVNGSGSKWTTSGGTTNSIAIGSSGAGLLSITNGGAVTASTASVGNTSSILTVDDGYGSSLNVGGGTGTITNNGAVRLVAGAGAASGVYTPISYGTMSGTGTVQALGGVWNSANHTVTVSAAATGTTGTGASFDLSQVQRALITDTASGKSVGAGFMAASTSTPVTFNASLISNAAELNALQSAISPTGESVLSDWTFSLTGTTVSSTNPTYFSLFAGKGQSVSNDLEIWGYNGSTWTQLAANDLAYDGTYASFTATSLEDYAVTGQSPTPIPPTVWLFGPGLLGLVGLKRKYLG